MNCKISDICRRKTLVKLFSVIHLYPELSKPEMAQNMPAMLRREPHQRTDIRAPAIAGIIHYIFYICPSPTFEKLVLEINKRQM